MAFTLMLQVFCKQKWTCRKSIALPLPLPLPLPMRRLSNTVGHGPRMDKLKVIPFSQDIRTAEKTFESYHKHGFFSVPVSRAGAPEEVFLPFWVVSCKVQSQIEQAQVGRSVTRTYYNPATKKHEMRWDTEWAWIPQPHSFSREYLPSAHSGLQVYASQKYRRGFVSNLCTGTCLQNAIAFSPSVLDRPTYSDLDLEYREIQRKVDPYTVYPTTALRFAKSYIQSKEEALADDFLRTTYSGDQTRLLKVKITLLDVQVSPVYYPAYVYTIRYLGRHLRTFISGNDLSVGGLRIYNWERVAAVTALSTATITTASGGIGWGGLSGSFWAGVILPTVVISLLTMYYPVMSLRARDAIRQHEIKLQSRDQKLWDDDWVRAFDAFEEQQRFNNWKTEQTYQEAESANSWTRGRSPNKDPKGYYRTLGIKPNATKADIQGAFRGLAMKHHPDRYTNADEKAKANQKFQELNAAYSVLRDVKRRKIYDETGSG